MSRRATMCVRKHILLVAIATAAERALAQLSPGPTSNTSMSSSVSPSTSTTAVGTATLSPSSSLTADSSGGGSDILLTPWKLAVILSFTALIVLVIVVILIVAIIRTRRNEREIAKAEMRFRPGGDVLNDGFPRLERVASIVINPMDVEDVVNRSGTTGEPVATDGWAIATGESHDASEHHNKVFGVAPELLAARFIGVHFTPAEGPNESQPSSSGMSSGARQRSTSEQLPSALKQTTPATTLPATILNAGSVAPAPSPAPSSPVRTLPSTFTSSTLYEPSSLSHEASHSAAERPPPISTRFSKAGNSHRGLSSSEQRDDLPASNEKSRLILERQSLDRERLELEILRKKQDEDRLLLDEVLKVQVERERLRLAMEEHDEKVRMRISAAAAANAAAMASASSNDVGPRAGRDAATIADTGTQAGVGVANFGMDRPVKDREVMTLDISRAEKASETDLVTKVNDVAIGADEPQIPWLHEDLTPTIQDTPTTSQKLQGVIDDPPVNSSLQVSEVVRALEERKFSLSSPSYFFNEIKKAGSELEDIDNALPPSKTEMSMQANAVDTPRVADVVKVIEEAVSASGFSPGQLTPRSQMPVSRRQSDSVVDTDAQVDRSGKGKLVSTGTDIKTATQLLPKPTTGKRGPSDEFKSLSEDQRHSQPSVVFGKVQSVKNMFEASARESVSGRQRESVSGRQSLSAGHRESFASISTTDYDSAVESPRQMRSGAGSSSSINSPQVSRRVSGAHRPSKTMSIIAAPESDDGNAAKTLIATTSFRPGRKRDELQITAGDLLRIVRIFDDGWAYGVNVSAGKREGFFPVDVIKSLSRRVIESEDGKVLFSEAENVSADLLNLRPRLSSLSSP